MYCGQCGAQNNDGSKFCKQCGALLESTNSQQSSYQATPDGSTPYQGTSEKDIQDNKTMAILAYFIFFLPLIAAKDSKFARYHANQGLLLLIAYVALGIVNSIISAILLAAFAWGVFGVLGTIFTLLYLALAVLGVLGIINAAQGKMAPMPLIGKLFTIIK